MSQKNYKYNILYKCRYLENSRISPLLKLPTKLDVNSSVLLIHRKYPLTKDEIQVQREIKKNEFQKKYFRSNNLYRFEVDDQGILHKSDRRSVFTFLHRMLHDCYDDLKKFRYVVFINPTFDLISPLRSLVDNSIVIVIYTTDFDEKLIKEEISNYDVIICGDNFSPIGIIRRLEKTPVSRDIVPTLINVMESLEDKGVDAFIPIINGKDYDNKLLEHNINFSQVILTIGFSKKNSPIVDCDFTEYLRILEKNTIKLLVLSSVFLRYKSFLVEDEFDLFKFLSISMMDGIRYDIQFTEEN